jgi:hypothetical protein
MPDVLDDPRVNFAISMNRQPVGVNDLGFQFDPMKRRRLDAAFPRNELSPPVAAQNER